MSTIRWEELRSEASTKCLNSQSTELPVCSLALNDVFYVYVMHVKYGGLHASCCIPGMTCSTPQDLLDSYPVSVPTSLQNSTPESSNSDSPNQADSGSNYSPVSNPYAERPSRRTSAGEAALVAANMPPSPPPFTPAESVSAGHPAYSGDSCGSRGHAGGEGSPGAMSNWAGSSTKTTQPQSFAFAPHVPGDKSPDVQPFKTTPEVSRHDKPHALKAQCIGLSMCHLCC
jgi:hypothetical protein